MGQQQADKGTGAKLEGDRDLFGLEDDNEGEFEMTLTIQGWKR